MCLAFVASAEVVVADAGEKNATADRQARTTFRGCACAQQWSSADGTCDNYCCNPNGDAVGSWCHVANESCQGDLWGYCAPICVCDHGASAIYRQAVAVAAEQAVSCTTHGAHLCERCDAGYHLVEGRCKANVCACENGEPAEGASCAMHGGHACASCDAGLHLTAELACAPNSCVCSHGTPAAFTACLEDGDHVCAECEGGYELGPDLRCLPASTTAAIRDAEAALDVALERHGEAKAAVDGAWFWSKTTSEEQLAVATDALTKAEEQLAAVKGDATAEAAPRKLQETQWVLVAPTAFCSENVRKDLRESGTSLAECQELALQDPDCGSQMFGNGEACRCVLMGKTCDFQTSGNGHNVYEYQVLSDSGHWGPPCVDREITGYTYKGVPADCPSLASYCTHFRFDLADRVKAICPSTCGVCSTVTVTTTPFPYGEYPWPKCLAMERRGGVQFAECSSRA